MRILLAVLLILALLPCFPAQTEETCVLTCLINFDWYPVKSFSGLIPEEIEKQTSVHLDVSIARDDQEILARIASGTLPDLIYTATLLDTLSNEDLCYDYDSLIDLYAPDWEINEVQRRNATTYSKDQKLYTLLNHYTSDEEWENQNAVPMCGSMLVRQDILDKWGLSYPRTAEDFFLLLSRVHAYEPDIIPLVFSVSHRFKVFKYWYGIGDVPFVALNSGAYRYYARDDRYYQMLRALNRAYQEGCISLDNFVAADQEVMDLYSNGRAFGMSYCTQSLAGINVSLASVNPAYSATELPPVEGADYTVSEIGWAGTFISKNCRHPDTAIRFLQWMFSPQAQRLTQWGIEGRDYQLDENQNPVFSEDVLQARKDKTYTEIYCPWFYFGGSAIVEAKGRLAQGDYSSAEDTYRKINALYSNQSWQRALLNPPDSPNCTIYNLAEDIVDQYEDQLITCASDDDFDYMWNQMQKTLISVNIEELEHYVAEKAAEGAADHD